MFTQERIPIGSILLVDDDANVVKALARLLRSSCDQVFTALNGEEALAILATQQIDVIVSDSLTFPVTGIELIRRARHLFPKIATILLSGQSSPADIRQARQERILQTYMPKPWDNDELVAAIRENIRAS